VAADVVIEVSDIRPVDHIRLRADRLHAGFRGGGIHLKAVLIGVLASSLTLALLTVRMLDFHSRALCSSLHTTSTRHLRKPIIRLRPLSRMAQRASE
jgi:hypothetical protein